MEMSRLLHESVRKMSVPAPISTPAPSQLYQMLQLLVNQHWSMSTLIHGGVLSLSWWRSPLLCYKSPVSSGNQHSSVILIQAWYFHPPPTTPGNSCIPTPNQDQVNPPPPPSTPVSQHPNQALVNPPPFPWHQKVPATNPASLLDNS